MEKRDECQGHWRVLVRLPAKFSGQKALQEFERGHMFFAGKGEGPVFGNKAEVVGMGGKEIENTAASLCRSF